MLSSPPTRQHVHCTGARPAWATYPKALPSLATRSQPPVLFITTTNVPKDNRWTVVPFVPSEPMVSNTSVGEVVVTTWVGFVGTGVSADAEAATGADPLPLPPVRRKRDRRHRTCVSRKLAQFAPARRVPQPHGIVQVLRRLRRGRVKKPSGCHGLQKKITAMSAPGTKSIKARRMSS
jgi:hypothetical protein